MACAMQVHTRRLKLDPDVTDDVLQQVARDLPGLSGQPTASHALLWCHSSVTEDTAVPLLKRRHEDS